MLILALKLISALQAATLPFFMFNTSNASLQNCHSHLPGHEFLFGRPAGTSLPSQVSTFPSRILTSHVGKTTPCLSGKIGPQHGMFFFMFYVFSLPIYSLDLEGKAASQQRLGHCLVEGREEILKNLGKTPNKAEASLLYAASSPPYREEWWRFEILLRFGWLEVKKLKCGDFNHAAPSGEELHIVPLPSHPSIWRGCIGSQKVVTFGATIPKE